MSNEIESVSSSGEPVVFNFGEAVERLKDGKMLQRAGWNGKGMFVFMQVPSNVPSGVVPGMQSLPQAVKDEFVRRFDDGRYHLGSIFYSNQLVIVDQGNLIQGWAPSASDALAQDWSEYKRN